MITISVCVGSACHLKGSREVIEGLQRLIKENNVSDRVEIKGAFCIGRCMEAVSVTVNDEGLFSLNENNIDSFFNETILRSISNE
jgi:NADH:ubiquinone oxidoreductase subunit E